MSYIPDYRGAENEKLLNDVDRAFLAGYRAAKDDAECFFYNLDIYGLEACPGDTEAFNDWMGMQETGTVCSVFESADYIPEDADIKDMNPPLYPSLKAQREAKCKECEIHIDG